MLTRAEFLHSLGLAALGLLPGGNCTRRRTHARLRSPAPPAGGQPLTRIAVLSDTHITDASGTGPRVSAKLAAALDDFAQFRPDIYVVNGDATDMGCWSDYRLLGRILDQHNHGRPVCLTMGNHSFYDDTASDAEAVARFCRFCGSDRPYFSLLRPGLHLVLLSGEYYKSAPRRTEWAWLSQAQLRWLADVLARHRDLPTAVCLHQPLNDTVLQSEQPNTFAGAGESGELRRILIDNPQVRLWFSGHTHIAAAAARQAVRQGRVQFVAGGSTFYLGRSVAEAQGPGTGDQRASESRWLEVYPDRLLVRARDHRGRRWLQDLDLSLPLA